MVALGQVDGGGETQPRGLGGAGGQVKVVELVAEGPVARRGGVLAPAPLGAHAVGGGCARNRGSSGCS